MWAEAGTFGIPNRLFPDGLTRPDSNFPPKTFSDTRMKKLLLLPLSAMLVMCEFGPAPLNLGEAPKTNAKGELTIPLNVTKAFSPTGYFYNVWAPADTTYTKVDPEKWNNFLAYQSIYLHPSCVDRVPVDSLAKYDEKLGAITTPAGFYSEFACSQFTYAPSAADDLYGGVFWLRNNNFGNHPGVKVAAGAKRISFWARTLTGQQTVKFGAGVYNTSSLKPWYYFTRFVDTFGNPTPTKTALRESRMVPDPVTGVPVETVVEKDSVLEGTGTFGYKGLNETWAFHSIDLNSIYDTFARTVKVGGVDTLVTDTCIMENEMIGAFYWAIDANFIINKDHVTTPIPLPDGTKRQAKYGAATILIDGIRYE